MQQTIRQAIPDSNLLQVCLPGYNDRVSYLLFRQCVHQGDGSRRSVPERMHEGEWLTSNVVHVGLRGWPSQPHFRSFGPLDLV